MGLNPVSKECDHQGDWWSDWDASSWLCQEVYLWPHCPGMKRIFSAQSSRWEVNKNKITLCLTDKFNSNLILNRILNIKLGSKWKIPQRSIIIASLSCLLKVKIFILSEENPSMAFWESLSRTPGILSNQGATKPVCLPRASEFLCRASGSLWQLARQASEVEPETLKMYTQGSH